MHKKRYPNPCIVFFQVTDITAVMVIAGGFVVFEPVLAPDTHIGVRENGDIKKPSHTGTRKHARFTPIMKVLLHYSTVYS